MSAMPESREQAARRIALANGLVEYEPDPIEGGTREVPRDDFVAVLLEAMRWQRERDAEIVRGRMADDSESSPALDAAARAIESEEDTMAETARPEPKLMSPQGWMTNTPEGVFHWVNRLGREKAMKAYADYHTLFHLRKLQAAFSDLRDPHAAARIAAYIAREFPEKP